MARIEPSEVVRRLVATKADADRTAKDAAPHLPWTERLKKTLAQRRRSVPRRPTSPPSV